MHWGVLRLVVRNHRASADISPKYYVPLALMALAMPTGLDSQWVGRWDSIRLEFVDFHKLLFSHQCDYSEGVHDDTTAPSSDIL